MFLPSGILAITSIYYKVSDKRKKLKRKLILIYILAMTIGILTSFKYTVVLIASVGLVQMSQYIKLKNLIIIGSVFLALMTFSAFYFMGMENGTVALQYVFSRATAIALEGTVGIYNHFPNGGDDAWMALLYAFGNKLASLLTGYSVDSVDFLKVNITRLIGYLTYPKADEALSGAFNLTVTNFGEGVYYFGKYYYFIFSIITGIILGTTIRFFLKTLGKSFVKNSIITVYMMIVIFPWLMGGVIGNLFGIPTIIYFSILYFVLNIINSNILYKIK